MRVAVSDVLALESDPCGVRIEEVGKEAVVVAKEEMDDFLLAYLRVSADRRKAVIL